MKIFALCLGLGFGIFAIAVYAYGLKHRIKDLSEKAGEKKIGLEVSFKKFDTRYCVMPLPVDIIDYCN